MAAPSNSLLDLDPGVGQVASMVRFDVLDRNLEHIGTINPLRASSIAAKTSGDVKRTLSGFTLSEPDLRSVDLYADRIKPWWVLEDGTEWPLGVFVFTDAAKSKGTYVSTLATTLMDQDYILKQGLRQSFGVSPGGWIPGAIVQLLDDCRILNRSVPDDSTKVVADPKIWQSGTSRLAIISELCELAGWLPPYFNNDGLCIVRPPPNMSTTSSPDHTYTARRIEYGTIVENDNLLDAPNVFVVICNGPSKGDISASAQVDAALPFSVENRGFEIPVIRRVQGVVSTEQAQRMADTLAAGAARGYKNVRFSGNPDPRHDLFDTVAYEGVVYREVSWNLGLSPGGPMSHTLTLGGFSNG